MQNEFFSLQLLELNSRIHILLYSTKFSRKFRHVLLNCMFLNSSTLLRNVESILPRKHQFWANFGNFGPFKHPLATHPSMLLFYVVVSRWRGSLQRDSHTWKSYIHCPRHWRFSAYWRLHLGELNILNLNITSKWNWAV